MKRVLIIALCFIPLINAADDKEIAHRIAGMPYRGYILDIKENSVYSFVGIWKFEGTSFLGIAAQFRGNRHDHPDFVECVLNNDQNKPSSYQIELGISHQHVEFTQSNPADHKFTSKALTLLQLYTSTHAKRTALEAKPVSESEKSQPE